MCWVADYSRRHPGVPDWATSDIQPVQAGWEIARVTFYLSIYLSIFIHPSIYLSITPASPATHPGRQELVQVGVAQVHHHLHGGRPTQGGTAAAAAAAAHHGKMSGSGGSRKTCSSRKVPGQQQCQGAQCGTHTNSGPMHICACRRHVGWVMHMAWLPPAQWGHKDPRAGPLRPHPRARPAPTTHPTI
jgi:hypothetical protein